jgi:hypothetical protein
VEDFALNGDVCQTKRNGEDFFNLCFDKMRPNDMPGNNPGFVL